MNSAPWASLAGAAFCWIAAAGYGRWWASRTSLPAAGALLAGACLLGLAVMVLGVAGWLSPGLLLAVGGLGVWLGRPTAPPSPAPFRPPLWILPFLPLAVVYLVWAMAPEVSPDGLAYHWNLPARYLREGRVFFEPASIYAQFPQALEMLYAFGLAFAPRAPALIHLGFLVLLVVLIIDWARPLGLWRVAVPAALCAFAAPVVGVDAASAYGDVALAAVCFAVFRLLDAWRATPDSRLLLTAGLLAGFAMSLKYTGALAILYLLGFLLRWRVPAADCARATAAALLPIAPWLLKNAYFTGNPVAPFFNTLFPNAVFDPGLEAAWLANLSWPASGVSWLQLPVEVCLRGELLRGLLGPAFLLLPLALWATRLPEGRRLLVPAILFSLPFAANAGTRFLIPALAFWSLLLMLALARVPAASLAIAALQVIMALPPVLDSYVPFHAWRINEFPWAAAVGLEDERTFLARRLPVAGLLPALDHAQGTVLALGPYPEAYTTARIWTINHSRLAADAARTLWSAVDANLRPVTRLRFWFPVRSAQEVRLVQTSGPPLSLAELHLYDLLRPLRITLQAFQADPNPGQAAQSMDAALYTRWTSWQRPGVRPSLAFSLTDPVPLSRLDLDLDGIDPLPGLQVQTKPPGGAWVLASDSYEVVNGVDPGLDPLAETLRALWAEGIRHVLIQDSDLKRLPLALLDRDHDTPGWRYRRIAAAPGARLYRLEPSVDQYRQRAASFLTK